MSEEQTTASAGGPINKRHKFVLPALILGGVSVAVPILFPCAIAALVLGSIALLRINKDPEHLRGKGLAIVGVATAGTSIVYGLPVSIAIIIPLLFGGAKGPVMERVDTEIESAMPMHIQYIRPDAHTTDRSWQERRALSSIIVPPR